MNQSNEKKEEEQHGFIVALEEGREELVHVVLRKGAGEHKENKVWILNSMRPSGNFS